MEIENKIWAKSIKYDKNEKEPPITLREHTNNVLSAFCQLKNKLEDEQLKESIKTAIELHDIGKVNPYFQIRTLGNKKYKPFDVTNNIYHSLFSTLWINKTKLKERFGENFAKLILSAVAYHHWKESFEDLIRFGGNDFEKLSDWLLTNNNLEILYNNLKSEGFTDEIISFDFEMLEGLKNGISFAEYVTPLYNLYWLPKRIEIDEEIKRKWILLTGFLIRSDHFASFCESENEEYKIEEDGFTPSFIKSNIIANIKEKNNNFDESQFWQDTVVREYGNDNTILIAPTGSGKTEFSFLWSNGEKFFYTLPLRSAVNQIYDRAKKIFGEEKVGLIHSDADVYLIGMKDEANTMKLYELSRQLSFPVIISTGDQFFPYALQPPGYEKIFATFYKARLVIDEVQAYDPKASAIIVKFIEAVTRMGGKFLLMTATLPSYIKEEVKKRIEKFVNDKEWKEPINRYENEPKYKELKKHRIQFIHISNSINDNKPDYKLPNEIIKKIIAVADQGKRVLVILNTVKQAQYVYDELQKGKKGELKSNLWLLHSRFTLEDRREKEIELIGKEFKNPKDETNEKTPKILVATQVVEASLDIDADVLFTEIAPLDALVQRMGRVLRRYKDSIPEEPKEPNIYVIVFNEGYESGYKKVYENELIEKTIAILKSSEEIINSNEKRLNEIIKKYYDKKGNFIGFVDNKVEGKKSKTKKGKKNKKEENDEELIIDLKMETSISLLLSEYEKFILVSKLYAALDKEGKYLKKFYDTLDILDAGYMSDRKTEAQRMFREISSISVIPNIKKDEFANSVIDFFNNIPEQKEKQKGLYTKFKKEILAKYVVSVPMYTWYDKCEYRNSVENWADINSNFDSNIKKKLKSWCREIYFVDYDYDPKTGVNSSNEKERE
ncbi:MAG: CRISPR-associated helicase Cas3' [Melioribacter sp.]|uniref:CRISPR-associated helicase Cas3' n=1 Tax=Rosettibacter primus TaxID=3111523 RepID=UPI00247BE04E|nr:CRISPR-associated helicase Cas3' [Melioribacter sp.]